MRQRLGQLWECLDRLRARTLTQDVFPNDAEIPPDDPTAFDDMDDIEGESRDEQVGVRLTRAQTAARVGECETMAPIEQRQLPIPSAWPSFDSPYRVPELKLRIPQATRTIQALRDSIADKSFQYSHVIRVAPRKGVRTRARATIAKLNQLIAYHSRVYARCRAAMVTLGADADTLNNYRILLKEHVKSSSALLNPNEPGSSRMQLSWIWQSAVPGSESSPDRLRECEHQHLNHVRGIDRAHSVNRVHWIRARAQKHRWQEEYTLCGYEMQWTVRYYQYYAKLWEDRARSTKGVGEAGPAAYCIRKSLMWTDLATAAEARFRVVNPRYQYLKSSYQQLAQG